MQENKKVSIVLPVYNGEKYLKQSIESIINQSYKNLELIIVNDCSTDSSLAIIELYVQMDDRVKLINNEQNLKLPASLNKGFSVAKGDFLTWSSDDNILYPNMIQRMAEEIMKGYDFVYANMDYIDSDGEKIVNNGDNKLNYDIWSANIIGACFMYTRRVYDNIGEYNTKAFLVEDYDYWIRIAKQYELKHVDEVLYAYRIHPNSLSSSRRRDVIEATLAYLEQYLKDTAISDDCKNKIRVQFINYNYELNRRNGMIQYMNYLKKNDCIKYKNLSWRFKLCKILPIYIVKMIRRF